MRLRERISRWLRPPRRLKFTREGKYFFGMTLGVGVAAINTGNNLLYLLLGMMLSLIVASGVLSELSLRGIEVLRLPPSSIHARNPFLVGISLHNRKRRLPSFSIEVEELSGDKTIDKKCYFLKVPAGRSQHTSYRHAFDRRGIHRLSGLRISTRFPFALFKKSRLIELEAELLVYPALRSVASLPWPSALARGEAPRQALSRSGEFAGLHEFREGDDPRDIHWPTTARLGRLVAREYDDESGRRLSLFVDNGVTGGDPQALESLEHAISLAASLAREYLRRGFSVRLVARGSETQASAMGPSELPRLLRLLALLPVVSVEVPFAISPSRVAGPILVTGRGRGGAFPGSVIEA